MEDFLKILSGAIIQKIVDSVKTGRKKEKENQSDEAHDFTLLKMILLFVFLFVAVCAGLYLVHSFLKSKRDDHGKADKSYSFLPFGHKGESDDPDEEEDPEDPDIAEDLEEEPDR